ncbi:MAG: drug/metabolite transporter (DMT)-like permease [Myxococcota bacterium]|jgi:drug/metabolite transporter (DMT)-like permease
MGTATTTDGARTAWPIVWCLAAAALFGASTPASKLLLDGAGPLTLAGLLYLGAGLATLPFALRGGAAARRRDPANVRRLLGAVLAGGVIGPVALLVGLQTAPSASVSLWLNLETTATAVLAWSFFRENLDGRAWLANGLVVVAGVLLAAPSGFAVAPAAGLVLLACVCWGLDNNLTALIDGYTPAQTTLVKGLVAGSVNLGLGLFLEGSLPGLATIAAAMGVGALAYGASIVLYIRGAQQLGATRSQMFFATAPFLGVAVAWVVLGEPVLGVQLLAAGLMVAALAILMTSHHAHAHEHAAVRHTHAHRHDDDHHGHSHPGLPVEAWHTHEHSHDELAHSHPHVPDLHHRHSHR